MLPLFTFFTTIISAYQYFAQRKKRYKLITIVSIIQTISTVTFNFIFASLFIIDGALVYSLVIGQLCAIIYCIFKIRDFKINFNLSKLFISAKAYINFPKYMLVSDIAFTITQQIPPILFSILFSTAIVGFFSLANRILKIPAIVLGASISNVFRNEAIDYVQLNKNPKPLFISTFKKLLIVSIPSFIMLGILSPAVFVFVFGQKWQTAGSFAQLLSFMIFFDFISSPFNSLFYILKKQSTYMAIQVVRTIANVFLIFLGKYLFKDAYGSLICFVLSDVIFSCFLLIFINKILDNYSINNDFKKISI
jgi:O-antigen/teichoic acid export membrane protein